MPHEDLPVGVAEKGGADKPLLLVSATPSRREDASCGSGRIGSLPYGRMLQWYIAETDSEFRKVGADMPENAFELRTPTTTKDLIRSVLKGGGVKKGEKSAKGG